MLIGYYEYHPVYKIAQNRVLWLFFKCPKFHFVTPELSPCDNYRPVTIFWPCPDVVIISNKYCRMKDLYTQSWITRNEIRNRRATVWFVCICEGLGVTSTIRSWNCTTGEKICFHVSSSNDLLLQSLLPKLPPPSIQSPQGVHCRQGWHVVPRK